jgi:hypothetical protein
LLSAIAELYQIATEGFASQFVIAYQKKARAL